MGPLIPLFRTSGDICLRFQNHCGSLVCMPLCLHAIVSSDLYSTDVTPAGLLMSSIAAYLYNDWWDSNPGSSVVWLSVNEIKAYGLVCSNTHKVCWFLKINSLLMRFRYWYFRILCIDRSTQGKSETTATQTPANVEVKNTIIIHHYILVYLLHFVCCQRLMSLSL